MTRILFITWDGSQTNYIESLFMPIFHAIQEKEPQYEFHVLQFNWADSQKIESIAEKAESLGIIYNHHSIQRKPFASIGSIITVFQGIQIIKKYIRKHHINIVMPRSTMPAMMINRIKRLNIKIIFDADGLPLEERVDFARLKMNSLQYKFLKQQEIKLLKNADVVIVRSNKAIDIHVNNIGEKFRNKFYKVTNGKDTKAFTPNLKGRNELRESLSIQPEEKVFVYCGSLGEQYCWEEMQSIVIKYLNFNSNSRFLVLTGSPSFLDGKIENNIKGKFIIKTIPAMDVPAYLNIADIAFAIRKPTFSMQGVSPIKLSEYLLTGLPTIASKGIGDTEDLLKDISGCYLYDHTDTERIDKTVQWIISEKIDRKYLSQSAKNLFSLEKSAGDYIGAFMSIQIN
jgi:glycosyltransferase involved in cell wall biosynthesis